MPLLESTSGQMMWGQFLVTVKAMEEVLVIVVDRRKMRVERSLAIVAWRKNEGKRRKRRAKVKVRGFIFNLKRVWGEISTSERDKCRSLIMGETVEECEEDQIINLISLSGVGNPGQRKK